jgi:uncharacterized protein involved in exopolysaccharide biosynthesis
MANAGREDHTNVGSVFGTLARRWRFILGAMVLGALLGAGLNWVLTPVYRGRVRVEIRRPPDAPRRGTASFQSEQVAMYTAAEMITNRSLLGRVAEEYRDRGWIQGDRRPGDDLAGLVGKAGDAASRAMGRKTVAQSTIPDRPESDLSAEIDWLQLNVQVQPVRDTRLVDVMVENSDSTAARVIAGRIAELFVEYANGPGASDGDSTVALTTETERPLRRAVPIVDHAALQARLRLLNTNLTDLSGARRQAQQERIDAENELARLRRVATDSLAGGDESGALGTLRHELSDCQARLETARSTYGPRHPRLVEAESQCAEIRAAIQRESRRALDDQRALVASRSARENSLSDELAHTEAQLRSAIAVDEATPPPDDSPAAVTAIGTPVPAVTVADGPMVEPQPVRPHKVINILVAALTAGLIASAIALWKLGDTRALRTPEEVEAELGLPVLGLIPRRPRAAMMRGL